MGKLLAAIALLIVVVTIILSIIGILYKAISTTATYMDDSYRWGGRHGESER